MASKAGKDLLKEERESVLSRALDALILPEIKNENRNGLDSRKTIAALLDYVIDDEDSDNAAAEKGLKVVAGYLSDNGMTWNSAEGLWRALIASIFEHLDGKSDRAELSRISGRLLQAQAKIFESFMDAEGRKRARLTRELREADRFPDTIAATLDPITLTRLGIDRLKELLHMDRGAIMSVDTDRRLRVKAGELATSSDDLTVLELKGHAALNLFELGEPYWEGYGEDVSSLGGLKAMGGGNAVLLLPMIVRGRTTGIVYLCGGPERRVFSPEEIEVAGRFANRLAVALENASLHAREQRKIKEMVALLEITRAINSTLDLREILLKVVQMTVDLCGVVMCAIYLQEDEAGRFVPAASYGFIEEGWRGGDVRAGFSIEGVNARELKELRSGEPVALPPSQAECLFHTDVLEEHGVDLVFVFPLRSKEQLTGFFALFYPCREAGDLDMEDVEVVRAIAAQASMAIENAALYEDIEKSYFSTVKALAKAIEVKDPYTHGHSERVTEYALLIAEAMNLEDRDKQKLKYAATLHDIGKIGIAGRVLNKPGSLTEEEYRHVKTHPLLGDSIIEPVEFLQGPRPIILHHHEHYDGSGYPLGLKGEGIPLCARILSVADAFEAMRSDRPYRQALSLEKARSELVRNAGTQFDPMVVEAFLGILDNIGKDPIER
ncbi:MAG: GAF domain-containing protein [Actinobacteria bacterium]|nr:GAF domain-containing protein [Actinomycetota bacterium]